MDKLIRSAGINWSRNKLAEQFLEECCAGIEAEPSPGVLPTMLDLRRRLSKSVNELPQDFESQLREEVSKMETRLLNKLTEAQHPKRKKAA